MSDIGNNGKSALLLIRDQTTSSIDALNNAPMPDYKACPAGGEEYHQAMASGMKGQLMWQRVQIERDLSRYDSQKRSRDDDPEIRSKWFTAHGAGAMTPVVLMFLIAALAYVIIKIESNRHITDRNNADTREAVTRLEQRK